MKHFKMLSFALAILVVSWMTYSVSGLVWAILTGVILLFAGTYVFGAPYVPTLRADRELALKLLDLAKGQTLCEMGAGDGSLCLLAAKQGLNVVGYEINPILALLARIKTWKYRKTCKIICGDMFGTNLSEFDGVYVFLAGHIAKKFEAKFKKEARPGTRLVSQGFEFGLREVKTGAGRASSLHLYVKHDKIIINSTLKT
jgi:Methyltransferase domain